MALVLKNQTNATLLQVMFDQITRIPIRPGETTIPATYGLVETKNDIVVWWDETGIIEIGDNYCVKMNNINQKNL